MYQHITHWIFDMDGTVYPENPVYDAQVWALLDHFYAMKTGLPLEQASAKMKSYMASGSYGDNRIGMHQADGIDYAEWDAYWGQHGNPSIIPLNAHLRPLIHKLPGKKIIYTDSDAAISHKLLTHLGILDCFDELSTFTQRALAGGPSSKANPATYAAFHASLGVPASQVLFFENSLKNLQRAKALGWKTVLLHGDNTEPYVDAAYPDLATALEDIVGELA
ncbi:MAG: HAD-IA family hydrolase [Alphaproteobacteria bacterium]